MEEIKIHTFGVLRDFFSSDFVVKVNLPISVKEVVSKLEVMQPNAAKSLSSCRVAVSEEIIPVESILSSATDIYLLPPSSGG